MLWFLGAIIRIGELSIPEKGGRGEYGYPGLFHIIIFYPLVCSFQLKKKIKMSIENQNI